MSSPKTRHRKNRTLWSWLIAGIGGLATIALATAVILITTFDDLGILSDFIEEDSGPQWISSLFAATTLTIVGTLYAIFVGMGRLRSRIDEISDQFNDPAGEQWKRSLHSTIPQPLLAGYSIEVQEFAEQIRSAVTDGRIRLKRDYLIDRFRRSYAESLDALSGQVLWATSLTSPNYFWPEGQSLAGGTQVESAIGRFCKSSLIRRGKIHRAFFVDDPVALTADEQDILQRQKDLGVTVYVLSRSEAERGGLDSLFVVNESGTFAWEVSVDGGDRISEVLATANANDARSLLELKRKIWALPSMRRFQ